MCKSIVFTSSKGGISKSTSVQTVGVILSQLGYKVLCVDTDNQSHLSTIFLKETAPESLLFTLTNLVESFINQESITKEMVEKAIVKTNTIDLLPSTFLLDKFEIGLNTINGREYFLSECLEKVEDNYDVILLDCNSSRNVFTINALAYAQEIVIPCQSQFLCSNATELILSTVKQIKRRINPNLKVSGILMTMYQNTNQSKNTVENIRGEYGDLVYNTIIPYSVKVQDSQKLGMSVVEYDKNNPVSLAYKEFVKELIGEEIA